MGRRAKSGRRTVPALKRRAASREPKRRFTLFCEGRNTEPAYFEAIKRAYRSAQIKQIDVKIERGVGVPYTVAEQAVAFAKSEGSTRNRRRKRESFEEGDEVWAVFDRDQHPRFKDAVALCEQKGIEVARSNPCFEVWLILHEKDYARPNNRHQVQKVLQQLRPEYNKRGSKVLYCDELVSRVQDAEQRGETLLKRCKEGGRPYGNPSTTVGRLCRAIREAHQKAS